MNKVWLPPMFYYDHAERALPSGTVMAGKVFRGCVLVECDDETLAEILNDAEFYADKNGPDMLPPGLKASAQRTVEAIKRFKATLT